MNIFLQKLLPKHALSLLAHRVCRIRARWFKNYLIRAFVSHFKVDTSLVDNFSPDLYACFNDFFTRELKVSARPLAQDATLTSPVDGCVSAMGSIQKDQIFQAKGHYYSVSALLAGDDALSQCFEDGQFLTAYLSPKDYHRIHMPVEGTLLKTTYVPGDLFSVNQQTAQGVSKLFARNERVVNVFDTALGKVALVMVGALNVGSMETAWQGMITPPYGKKIMSWDYAEQNICLAQGEYMGHFNMGSTIILLLEKSCIKWRPDLSADSVLQVKQGIATSVV